jgi:acetyltransferase (GNAT) family protein
VNDAGSVPFADLALSRRLERAEALSNARFVEARARLVPSRGSCWIEVAGAHAMYDGPSSPSTQTFGLGMWQAPSVDDLDRIEAFFVERGAPVFHEVSPLADAVTITMLCERGYQPFEFTSVLYRPIGEGAQGLPGAPDRARDRAPASPKPQSGEGGSRAGPRVRPIGAGEEELFARTSAEGWREAGYSDFMLDFGRINAATEGLHLFIAELDGQAIAAGAVSLRDGVAHLAGASTIPEGRRRGAQLALLDARLRHAAAHGCDVALMGALPGSSSQRNAERHGFRIAYTRVKWRRPDRSKEGEAFSRAAPLA